ncbi:MULTISPECIES: hypothetical protein [unclassified Rhodococcus (in: high G+C Gram-positive bacteria)]|uniref:hypothetical protein n=1 Tax=Rhodococcus TaxID=1827 RepID=UPI0006D1A056|nr:MULTISPECIES: hypothetical protein [unclassified Rhodococcus (in: high G+C Gram-positive bacteria)]MCK0091382.1 hypothetical protein [Rhodococcus sp. F64268]NLU63752.1 hypothetical protein [Rhodococcus sp. HNM0563]TCN48219.1 hypothetical protein EV641_118143 [Rhodococcus sp. SMB37]
MRTFSRTVSIVALAGAAVLGTAGTAAADEWPSDNGAVTVVVQPDFLVPSDGEFWNPLVAKNRLTSPFGESTRIECTQFHGVLLECWQADQNGNPHKLTALPFNFPAVTGSAEPGGGPSHFVYLG